MTEDAVKPTIKSIKPFTFIGEAYMGKEDLQSYDSS